MTKTFKAQQAGGNTPALSEQLMDFRNRRCALLYADPNYLPPTPDEVDQLIRLAGWSQTEVAKLVGVTFTPSKGSSTVRKWRSPVDSPHYRQIPYAAWRLMLLYLGVADLEQHNSNTK